MTFAEKLDYLFCHKRKPDGQPFTYADVVKASQGGLSLSHISLLRSGRRANPTYDIIQILADVFGVEPNYFFEPSPNEAPLKYSGEVSQEEKLDEATIELALRAKGLDDAGKTAIRTLLDYIEKHR